VESTKRFSSRVDYYVRSRPRYPAAVVQFCREQLGLRAEHAVADVGSGTGFLSQVFLDNGNIVYGVEPNDEMRRAGEQFLAGRSNFHSVNGTAEATELAEGSVYLVTAGQAFHWFDPVQARAEFARILSPEGWVALVWNERREARSPFAAAYQQIVQRFSNDQKVDHHKSVTARDSGVFEKFFAPGGFDVVEFENNQVLDEAGVRDRVLSSSYMPLAGDPKHEPMLAAVKEAFEEHQRDGTVVIEYATRVYYGQLG